MSERAKTARKWTQPKCPSTDRQRKKMWYIYAMEYDLVLEKILRIKESCNLQPHIHTQPGEYYVKWTNPGI